jgi:NAD(P)-dependent dehydrogenase (short-subunit alcohol dehydrogenase family)
MRLSGKKALVTGAASGIGKAVVNAFLHEGAEVIGADIAYAGRAPEPAEHLQLLELDVTREDDWERLAQHLVALDVLVACAGISDALPIDQTTLGDWRRVMDVNLDGAFLSVKFGARAMRQSGGGSIVVIGSASGVKALPGASAYCVSKAAVRMLVRAAALELRPQAIRVNCVSPAAVATPMWQKTPFWSGLVEKHGGEQEAWKALGGTDPAAPSMQRMAFPEEVAAAVLFLSCDESAHITGADLLIDAGYTL